MDFALERAAAVEAARAAGASIRAVYGRRLDVRFKSGDDPLTEADEAADLAIRVHLRAAFPADGWLSEESDPIASDGADRTWVVDPLDGTREFVDGIAEFAISIALLEAGRPVVAVVYQPIRDFLVSAVRGRGVAVEGRSAGAAPAADLASAVVLASRSEVKRGQWDGLRQAWRVRPTGSIAYKLACVAAGEADATISLAPKHGWDVAAGVLLVEEAGGRVSRLDGSPLTLTQPAALLDGLVASRASIHDELLARVAAERTATLTRTS